jgi:site-specific DNA recombinase
MSKRVGLLARVSGHSQEDNTSLDNQLAKTRAYAVDRGYEIVTTKTEIVTGAARWGARTAFNELLEMGDRGTLDAIIVDVPDRLGRGRALATLLDRAEKHGLDVLFADGTEIDSVTLGVAIITSGKEREDIGRRTREGRLKAIGQGKIVFSRAPFGYRIKRRFDSETGEKIGAAVEFEPVEISYVHKMYDWLVNQRETLHSIRLKLYEDKVLPPGLRRQYTWETAPEDTSRLWCRASIRNVLTNSAYVGKWHYNKIETKRVEGKEGMCQVRLGERSKEEWLSIDVPSVISQDLFEQAQAILKKNKEQQAGRPSNNRQYLLKGLLFCPCGWRMIGVTYKSGNGAYRCKRDITRVERECDAPRLSQEIVEDAVWKFVMRLMLHPEKVLAGIEEHEQEMEKQNALLRERIETLQAEIHKSEVRLDRLLDSFLDGTVDKPTYKRKQAEIEKGIADVRAELGETQQRSQRMRPLPEEARQALMTYCAHQVLEGLRNATFEDKRRLLLTLDVRVTHLPDRDAIKIEGTFPTAELSITS